MSKLSKSFSGVWSYSFLPRAFDPSTPRFKNCFPVSTKLKLPLPVPYYGVLPTRDPLHRRIFAELFSTHSKISNKGTCTLRTSYLRHVDLREGGLDFYVHVSSSAVPACLSICGFVYVRGTSAYMVGALCSHHKLILYIYLRPTSYLPSIGKLPALHRPRRTYRRPRVLPGHHHLAAVATGLLHYARCV